MRGDSNCEPYFTLPQSAAAVGGGRGSVCSSSWCFFVVYRHMSRFFGFLAPPRRLEIRVLVLAICHLTGRPRRGLLGGGPERWLADRRADIDAKRDWPRLNQRTERQQGASEPASTSPSARLAPSEPTLPISPPRRPTEMFFHFLTRFKVVCNRWKRWKECVLGHRSLG